MILLLATGLYPLRYLLLLVVLLTNYDVKRYEREILLSFVLTIFFLFVESLVNTAITKPTELASGTLGSNTFANVTVSILLLYIFLIRKKFRINKLLFLLFSGCCVLIILLTGTRIAIIAGIATFFLLQAYLFKWYKLALVALFTITIFIVAYNLVEVPKRYSYTYLASKIHFNGFSSGIGNIFFVERSQETSSILTRLSLYRTASYMLIENPAWGTGYGTFNYLKMEYGFNIPVLLDAHNGYLNTLAQLGLSGIFFLFLIYFYPILNLKRIQHSSLLSLLAVINLTMAICDLSNAGIYKYPVFALLAFNVVMISVLKKNDRDYSRNKVE
jgi:O-antigen ligase